MSRFEPLDQSFFASNPKISREERLPYPKYRYTKYFWLINLQQAAYTRKQAAYLVQLLRKAVVQVFTEGTAVAFAHPNHRWNKTYIGENELQIAIEVGPKKGRVHCHLIQEVKHRSMINIDPKDVKIRINALLAAWTGGRVTNVFVSRKVHPSSKPLEEYIDKDNVPWADQSQMVSGLFTYTLTNNGEQPNWVVYKNAPERVAEIPLREKAIHYPEEDLKKRPGPQPIYTPYAASSSDPLDFEFRGASSRAAF